MSSASKSDAERDADLDSFTLRYPSVYWITGAVGATSFVLMGGVPAFFGMREPAYFASMGCFAALGLFIVWVAVRWRIVVAGDDVTVTPIIGAVKRFKVSKIWRVRETNKGSLRGVQALDRGDRVLFSANANAVGFNLLFDRLSVLRGERPTPVVLTWSTPAKAIFSAMLVVFATSWMLMLVMGSGTRQSIIAMSICFALALGWLLSMILFQATVAKGVITVHRWPRPTRTIAVADVRFGRSVYDSHGRYRGFTLIDAKRRTVVEVRTNYQGFARFAAGVEDALAGTEGARWRELWMSA